MLSRKRQRAINLILSDRFNHCNITQIRKYLKSKAVNEYDCYHYSEDIGGGVEIGYTSNPNHFAEYYFTLRMVGYVNTLAMTKMDITKAGLQRGCGDYYAL